MTITSMRWMLTISKLIKMIIMVGTLSEIFRSKRLNEIPPMSQFTI